MPAATIRNIVRACAALVLALIPVVGGQGVAGAHATVVSTSPAAWEVLGATPDEVALTFSEPVDLGLASVELIGPSGDRITTGSPTHPEGRPEVAAVALPRALSDGSYTVNWHVTSADTHPARGAFVFSVGQPTAAAAAAPTDAHREPGGAVVLGYGVARWLAFAGFALLVGGAFFVAWCQAPGRVSRRVRVIVWSGWGSLLAGTALVFLLYGPYATGRPLTAAVDPALAADTAGTRLGVAMLVRLGFLALAGFALTWFARRDIVTDPARRHGVAVAVAACLLAGTWSAASHSAAGSLVWLALVADVVHLTAMAVWLGGLVVVGAVVVRADDVAAMRFALPRFSRVALVAVALLVVTGVFQAWRLVGGPSALLGTAYGRVLLAKVAVVVVLLAVGAAARRWVRRHYGFPVVTVSDKRRVARGPERGQVRRFGAFVAAEAVIAAVVLALTSALITADSAAVETASAASRPAEARPAPPGQPVTTAFDAGGAAGRGTVATLLTPGTVGPNELHVAVLDERGQPKEVAEVRVTLTLPERSLGPVTVPLRYGGVPGHYISDALSVPVSGRWDMSLAVRTSDVDEAIVQVPLGIP